MAHVIGWTGFNCGHVAETVFHTLQHLEQYEKQEYVCFSKTSNERYYRANAPRSCRKCLDKEIRAAKGKRQNFVEQWQSQWAEQVAAYGSADNGHSDLKSMLHQICPHLRSVGNFKEETFIKRVNSQLSLEGLVLSEDACPSKVDHETRQKVTRIVEDQLHMHRSVKLKNLVALQVSPLQEAEVAERWNQPPKLVHFRTKPGVVI